MKYTLFIFVLLLTFSCQSNHSALDEKYIKAEDFINMEHTAQSGIRYHIHEADNPDYKSKYVSDALRLDFQYRNTNREKGILKFNDLIERIIKESSEDLDLSSRVDLQIITYINVDQFILKVEDLEKKQQYAAENILRLVEYTKPHEWKLLTKVLLLSKPVISKSDYTAVKKYILEGANQTIKNPQSISQNLADANRLADEAQLALQLLSK